MATKAQKSTSTKKSKKALQEESVTTVSETDLQLLNSGTKEKQQDFQSNSPQPLSLATSGSNSHVHASLDNIFKINIDLLEPDPNQPRKLFDALSLQQLTNSIQATNFVDPLVVRENLEKPGSYFIVDGERRWRACKALNHSQITCCVISPQSLDYEIVAFSQNVQRDDLTTMEKAIALEKILAREKAQKLDFQQKDLIPVVNLSESYISELLKISKLTDNIKEEALKSTAWTRSKLLQLASIKNNELKLHKFEEFKEKIAKKQAKTDKTLAQIKDDISESANRMDEQANSTGAPMGKKARGLKKHANIFMLKLKKFKETKISASELQYIKEDLTLISKFINEILLK
ncbi:MAG: ParB/RepB/Spo0J family partition protein [Deltaproteobacteria bacterium]|nr:ParB/RepB/Spo0J family partition protein [Deltaproteobacteria bacterium]